MYKATNVVGQIVSINSWIKREGVEKESLVHIFRTKRYNNYAKGKKPVRVSAPFLDNLRTAPSFGI